jgi:hypothetical protein
LVNWNLISGIPSNFLDIYQIPLDEIRRSLPKFDRHLKLLFNFFFFFFYVKASSFILSLRIALSLPEGWCEPWSINWFTINLGTYFLLTSL